jgi:hypothetical protein
MDARPDKEEMEEAIENFLSRLEKQEQRGFKEKQEQRGSFATSRLRTYRRGHRPPQEGVCSAMTIRRSVKPIPVNACVLLGYPHISLHLHGISCDILMYCMHWQSGAAHVWMHRVGVRGLQGSYEGKMLPFQDARAHLSRNESSGKK